VVEEACVPKTEVAAEEADVFEAGVPKTEGPATDDAGAPKLSL
jgi:hypothetical protein